METVNLNLFDNTPQVQVSENSHSAALSQEPVSNPLKNIEQTLTGIFPDNGEENKVIKARRILGEAASSYSDEQLAGVVTDFEFLIEGWLDLFEKQTFEGKTLRELLGDSAHGHNK
mgnify:CR=1 FL=1